MKAGAKKDSGLAKSHKDMKQSTTLSYDFDGLTDEDAFAVAPVNLSGKNCNVNCMNEVCFIIIIIIILMLIHSLSSLTFQVARRRSLLLPNQKQNLSRW